MSCSLFHPLSCTVNIARLSTHPEDPEQSTLPDSPSRVSWWECIPLVRVIPKCHEHSALSKNTSLVKAGALNTHQLGALAVTLHISEETTSQTIPSVTDQRDQDRKFTYTCKQHFSTKANDTFCFTNKLVNKLCKIRSYFPPVKCYFGAGCPCQLFQKIVLASFHKDLKIHLKYISNTFQNAFLSYEAFDWVCSSNTVYIFFVIILVEGSFSEMLVVSIRNC